MLVNEVMKNFQHHSPNPGLIARLSAAGPVAGDGLRSGSGESAELPTEVKEVLAMFA